MQTWIMAKDRVDMGEHSAPYLVPYQKIDLPQGIMVADIKGEQDPYFYKPDPKTGQVEGPKNFMTLSRKYWPHHLWNTTEVLYIQME